MTDTSDRTDAGSLPTIGGTPLSELPRIPEPSMESLERLQATAGVLANVVHHRGGGPGLVAMMVRDASLSDPAQGVVLVAASRDSRDGPTTFYPLHGAEGDALSLSLREEVPTRTWGEAVLVVERVDEQQFRLLGMSLTDAEQALDAGNEPAVLAHVSAAMDAALAGARAL